MSGKKLSKKLIIAIITAAVALCLAAAILITNIFIPVKYLSAYVGVVKDVNPRGEMRITFLDVGGGDCTVIELPDGKSVLIDGGDGSYKNEITLLKKLNSAGIDKIDYLFLTSASSHRAGGLAEVVKYKDINKVFAPFHNNASITKSYYNFRSEVKKKGTYMEECAYGAGVINEEYGYCCFALTPDRAASDGASGGLTVDKIRSSAMWISYQGVNFLLLGDLGAEELRTMYDRYKTAGFDVGGYKINLEECNVVKPASGGAESGECTYLYDLLKAETAVISTAKEPAHGLLSDIEVYAGGNIYRTDKHGSIVVSVSDGVYGIRKEKR